MVEIRKQGRVVMRSRNLAAILRYQRKPHVYVRSVGQKGKTLTVRYSDGARCVTRFADASVLRGWIANRKKSGVFP